MARPDEALVRRVLIDSSLYPDEFKKWVVRYVQQAPTFQLPQEALPVVAPIHLVGGAGEPAFDNSWVNYDTTHEPAQYYKDPFGRVWLGGVVKNGTFTGSPGTGTIFTLPVGYRPRDIKFFPVVSNAAFGICVVNPDGTVQANTGSNVYFYMSGLSFRQYA